MPVLVLIPWSPFSIELIYVGIESYGFLSSLYQPCIVVWPGGAYAFLGDAPRKSFKEFHEDRDFSQVIVGFSCQQYRLKNYNLTL